MIIAYFLLLQYSKRTEGKSNYINWRHSCKYEAFVIIKHYVVVIILGLISPSTRFIQKVPGLLPLLKYLVSDTNRSYMRRKMNIRPLI